MAGLRLDKILSKSGFGSRKDVKKLVSERRVLVKGVVATDSGMKAEEADVMVDGNPVCYKEFIYLIMNKPQGVVSSTEKGPSKTVIDLLPEAYRKFEPFPVGRLDKDTEGLLLITNDGQLAHELLAPKKHVDKTYFAKIEGKVSRQDVAAFAEGLDIGEKKMTLPAKLEILESDEMSEILVTLHEGKFHQVKRMFEAVGKKVVFLKRVSMGEMTLPEDLMPGEFREVEKEFVQSAQKKSLTL
ncbi:MAG: rRNA pseudouridine synthase [Clostridia bacterium]|nr:rRNA pseudouridine synthase [Clostridia bacterium]